MELSYCSNRPANENAFLGASPPLQMIFKFILEIHLTKKSKTHQKSEIFTIGLFKFVDQEKNIKSIFQCI